MKSTMRKILQIFSVKYKRSNIEILEQIYQQFVALKNSSIKTKLKTWIIDWETLHAQIIEMNIQGQFEEKTMFVKEFLKVGQPWALNFCDHWYNQKHVAEQSLELFEIIKKYRVKVNEKSKSMKKHAHAVTLQKTHQSNVSNQQNQLSASGSIEKNNRKCLCEKMHLFRNCLYMHTSAKESDWKKNKKIRNDMRHKIKKNYSIYTAIKYIININILKNLKKKKSDQNDVIKSNASKN